MQYTIEDVLTDISTPYWMKSLITNLLTQDPVKVAGYTDVLAKLMADRANKAVGKPRGWDYV